MGWRLIQDEPRRAAENMAVDEAILRRCVAGDAPSTIRVYSWTGPAISLGCLQPLHSGRRGGVDVDYCREAGVELVRRITGGRAVIHGNDVTFSIALKESDLPSGCSSVIESHRWLMGGIVAGLRRLGIDAEVGPERGTAGGRDLPADCFAHVAECDVRVGPAKVVGSAQVRRYGGLLEQGSIPYAPPGFEAARVFGTGPFEFVTPLQGFDFPIIADAVIAGLKDYFSIAADVERLDPAELAIAEQLASERYGKEDWTLRAPGAGS